jgi:hypothetical protein
MVPFYRSVTLKQPPPPTTKEVRFDGDAEVFRVDHIHDLSMAERKERWYSKHDLSRHRSDMKRCILALQRSKRSIQALANFSSSSNHRLDPNSNENNDNDECYIGCERYFDMEMRQMMQKTIIEAVLEAQEQGLSDSTLLRDVSMSFSESSVEIARWHATLNAFHCYGSAGLKSTE